MDQLQNQATHRVGGPAAIVQDLIKVLHDQALCGHADVLLKGTQQIPKELHIQLVFNNMGPQLINSGWDLLKILTHLKVDQGLIERF
jgi:hypothetical protein